MKHIPIARKRPGSWSPKMGLIVILLAAVSLSTAWLMEFTASAAAVTPPQAREGFQLAPTPAAPAANAGSAPRTSPVVGILVLLAPLIFIAWKSRGKKEPKVTASCCMPVIDESKRPFQIYEDQPDPKTPVER